MSALTNDHLDALCEIDNMCMSAAAVRIEKKASVQFKMIKPKAKQGILSDFLSSLPEGNKKFLRMSFTNAFEGDFFFVFGESDISALISKLESAGVGSSEEEVIKDIADDISGGITETLAMLMGKADVLSKFVSFEESAPPEFEKEDVVFIEMQFKIADEVNSHFWHIVPSKLGLTMAQQMLGEIDSKLEEFSEKVTTQEKDKSNESKEPSVNVEIDVPVELCVEICRKEAKMKDLWNFSIGSIIEFKKGIKEPLDIVIKGKPYGKAQVVTVGEHFGIRVTEVINYAESIGSR